MCVMGRPRTVYNYRAVHAFFLPGLQAASLLFVGKGLHVKNVKTATIAMNVKRAPMDCA